MFTLCDKGSITGCYRRWKDWHALSPASLETSRLNASYSLGVFWERRRTDSRKDE